MATQPLTKALTQPLTMYNQCRTFNHVYLFKSKTDQSLTLKIFDLAQQSLIKIAAPATHLSEWSKIENAQSLLTLFIQQNLIPPDLLPSTPVVNPVNDLQQLILLAKSKVSVETENMKQFTCPITLEVFEDPVIDEHGHTFEKSAITEHLQKHRETCPINRQPIGSLTPNRSIKDAINEWKKQDPIPTFALFGRPNPVLFGKNLETALSCVEQNEYEEALESYAKAFKYTNDWKHYVELPKLFEKISDHEKATLAYLYLALYQLQDSKLTEALQTLEHCKKITPLTQQIDKLLIHLYHTNKQTDQAIKLALQTAQTLAPANPQEAIRLYNQVLSYDPCQWAVYQPLSLLLTTPQEKAHILLKGACHALDIKEYKIVQAMSKEAEKNYEDSFIDRLIDLEYVTKITPHRLKAKLLTLAQTYEQKNLIAPMVKVYKRLTRLDYDPTYYQKILAYTPEANKARWTLAWLSVAIENKDWPSAEQVAKIALKMTKEPIPILSQLETIYTHWHDHELNNLWKDLGREYLRTGQIEQAEKTYRKAHERFQSLENALALGEILHKQSKNNESMQVYYDASILALLSDNLESLDLCLRNIRQIDPALSCFTQAQKIHVVTQSQIINLSTKLQYTDAELKRTDTELRQLKERMKPAEVKVLPKAEIPLISTVISKKEWAAAQTVNLPPYPQELKDFLSGDCTIWPGKKRSETHIVVPLFPQVDINGSLIPSTLDSLDQLDKSSGGPGFSSVWDQIPKNTPAEKEFHYAVMTNDVIPGSRNRPYDDQVRLLPAGYEAPGVFDAARAILWENRRSGIRCFDNSPMSYMRCKEVIQGYHLVVGGFAPSGLDVHYYTNYDVASIGFAGWRKF